MSRKKTPPDGSYQHLNKVMVAFLQGRTDADSAVDAILDGHNREQIRVVLFDEWERYRRFNHQKFCELVERLRLSGVLW